LEVGSAERCGQCVAAIQAQKARKPLYADLHLTLAELSNLHMFEKKHLDKLALLNSFA